MAHLEIPSLQGASRGVREAMLNDFITPTSRKNIMTRQSKQ